MLGRHLDPSKSWYTARRASGDEWIPAFIEYVDPDKCIGCGLCVKVCMGGCYELRDVAPKEVVVTIGSVTRKVSVKRQAVVVSPEGCYGDCHCHKVCPVDGGAMVCRPKTLEELA